MTGASLTYRVDDRRTLRALKRLEGLGKSRALMAQIGETLVQSTRERFHQSRDPEGRRWQPLNPAYAAGKRGRKILVEAGMRGGLMGSIAYRAEDDRVTVGTNKVYAAPHQFGAVIRPKNAARLVFPLGGRAVFARQVTIPARPFLGISADDRREIGRVFEDTVDALTRQR